MSETHEPATRSRRARWLYFALAWVCFGIGVLGALLPLLPAMPFMLTALWAFSRSSQRFHDWLYHHRIFGPRLRLFKEHRVVPVSVKATAYVSMIASLSYLSFFSGFHWAIPIGTGVVMLVGIVYISGCPSDLPPKESEAEEPVPAEPAPTEAAE